MKNFKKFFLPTVCLILVGHLWAADSGSTNDLAGLANNVRSNLQAVITLAITGAYVAGIVLFISGLVKFKAHKDNPTQVPLSTPVVLIGISACLLFFPSLLDVAGSTVFGGDGGQQGSQYLDESSLFSGGSSS